MPNTSAFQAAWWLQNPHLQTLYGSLLRKTPALRWDAERLELADGDFLDLAWTQNPPTNGIAVVFHGLEGSIDSRYIKAILSALQHAGFKAVLMHSRGCSGTPNRLKRRYHAGETKDMAYVLKRLAERYPDSPLFALGYSLGGNALLKWLGENPAQKLVTKACAVSVPYNLFDAEKRLKIGFSRFYQWYLLRKLRESLSDKNAIYHGMYDLKPLTTIKTFAEFDDRYTAPLHGFDGVDDYYQRSSSQQFLKKIQTPTLLIHAKDDPFMFAQSAPSATDLSTEVKMDLSEKGGHVGFIDRQGKSWADQRICAWFTEA